MACNERVPSNVHAICKPLICKDLGCLAAALNHKVGGSNPPRPTIRKSRRIKVLALDTRPMSKPKLSCHKSKGLYFARLDGKQVHFGKDYAHAAQRFAEALVRYEGGEPIGKSTTQDSLTVVEAVDR